MSPRRTLPARSAWPPRAAQRLVPASGGRLLRQPLWLIWRRGPIARAPVLPAARYLPARAVSFALTLSYRIDWPVRREFVLQPIPVRGKKRLIAPPVRWSAETRFAAPAAGGATSRPKPWSAARRLGAERAGRVDRHGAMTRFRAIWPVPVRSVPLIATRIGVPVALMPPVGPPRAARASARHPAGIWHVATRRQQGSGRYAPAIDLEGAPPVRALSSRHAREDATVAPRGIGRVPLVLASRTAPRPGSDRPEAADVVARHPVELAWRAPAVETGEGTPGGQGWSGRRVSAPRVTAAPGAGVAPAAVDRAAPRMLEPAVAERLVEDVIRRVDRRMRIERERRGL
jgi:hypothetical protein